MKILLTAFEPFGGEPVNPAEEILRRIEAPAGAELQKLLLPTAFREAGALLAETLRRERPDALLSLGQAAGRAALSLERIGVNLMDASIPDNRGFQPMDEPVVPGAPAAYFSTLPVKKLAAAIREAGVEAAVSNSAGTFVCNSVLYTALHLAAAELPALRAGFLHVPALPEQAARMKPGTPSLPLADMLRGVEAALAALAAA